MYLYEINTMIEDKLPRDRITLVNSEGDNEVVSLFSKEGRFLGSVEVTDAKDLKILEKFLLTGELPPKEKVKTHVSSLYYKIPYVILIEKLKSVGVEPYCHLVALGGSFYTPFQDGDIESTLVDILDRVSSVNSRFEEEGDTWNEDVRRVAKKISGLDAEWMSSFKKVRLRFSDGDKVDLITTSRTLFTHSIEKLNFKLNEFSLKVKKDLAKISPTDDDLSFTLKVSNDSYREFGNEIYEISFDLPDYEPKRVIDFNESRVSTFMQLQPSIQTKDIFIVSSERLLNVLGDNAFKLELESYVVC